MINFCGRSCTWRRSKLHYSPHQARKIGGMSSGKSLFFGFPFGGHSWCGFRCNPVENSEERGRKHWFVCAVAYLRLKVPKNEWWDVGSKSWKRDFGSQTPEATTVNVCFLFLEQSCCDVFFVMCHYQFTIGHMKKKRYSMCSKLWGPQDFLGTNVPKVVKPKTKLRIQTWCWALSWLV